MDITQEMVAQSAKEEGEVLAQSPAVLLASNQFLQNRVVLLRALANQQQVQLEEQAAELEKLRARKRPSDRQPKKTAVKKAASPSQ